MRGTADQTEARKISLLTDLFFAASATACLSVFSQSDPAIRQYLCFFNFLISVFIGFVVIISHVSLDKNTRLSSSKAKQLELRVPCS